MDKKRLARQLGQAFRLGLAFRKGKTYREVLAQDEAKWITVHPNGKGMTKSGDRAKGQPVLIDGSTGEVLGGMGGKFNGKHISAVPKQGKEEQQGAQAKIDRAHTKKDKEGSKKFPSSQSIKTTIEKLKKIHVSFNVDTFKNVDEDVRNRNIERLDQLISSVKRMDDLLTRSFGIESSVGKLTSGEIAKTTLDFYGRQKLILSSGFYEDSERLRETQRKTSESGWHMPCDDDNLELYSVTHEFGHILHNVIFRAEIEKQLRDGTISAWDLRRHWVGMHKKLGNRIRSEVLKIAKKDSGEKTQNDIIEKYLSDYGRSDCYEFIAEATANAFCGKPNVIGKAMRKYLEGIQL